jgi:hypothetical protein
LVENLSELEQKEDRVIFLFLATYGTIWV